MTSPVEKNLGLFARPMTLRRAKAAGRLARIKADDAALGAARGAGRAFRYGRNNAMPLVLGASVGGGAATAYQQTKERRMSKSYLAARGERAVVKGLPSVLRQMSRKSPGMYKAPGATYAGQRVAASQVGRLNPAAGRGLQASVGGELRAKSRVTMAQQGGRKRLRSPRSAAAMGLNSYRNPLRNV